MRRSIMTEKIARRGYHIYREYGVDPLERHYVDEVMSRSVRTIDADMPVCDALARFFGETQTHRAYPAVRGETVAGTVDRATLEGFRGVCASKAADAPITDALLGRAPVVALLASSPRGSRCMDWNACRSWRTAKACASSASCRVAIS